jgi:hypothetical protein
VSRRYVVLVTAEDGTQSVWGVYDLITAKARAKAIEEENEHNQAYVVYLLY